MDAKKYLATLDAAIAVHERMAEYHLETIRVVQEAKAFYVRNSVTTPPRKRGGGSSTRKSRTALRYDEEVADRVVAVLRGHGEGGMTSKQIADALGYESGFVIKAILAKLHEANRVHGKLLTLARMTWFPQPLTER